MSPQMTTTVKAAIILLLLVSRWAAAGADSQIENPVNLNGVDPTRNVTDLVRTSQARNEDVRILTVELFNAKLAHLEEVIRIRADHSKDVRMLESDRLDKIRQIDVLAGTTAAERSQVAIETLARVTTDNAETLRKMVADTAAAVSAQTAAANAALTERIASLEKSSYVGAGRSAVADPALAELAAEMKMLRQAQSTSVGKSEGGTQMWGYVVGALGVVAMLLSMGIALIKFRATPVKVV